MNLEARSWAWVMELAYPPFAFLMGIKSSAPDPIKGLLMSDWLKYEVDERKTFEGIVELGFGWAPYPGDFRSRATIVAEREEDVADVVGHITTRMTHRVYRHQVTPTISAGKTAMESLFGSRGKS